MAKKTVLITGVSKGIGRTIAEKLHSEGFYIFGGYKWRKDYRKEETQANSLKKELKNLKLLPFDLGIRENTFKLTKEIGSTKLSAIVNNAGEFIENDWLKFDYDSWDRVIEVNMVAPLVIAQELKNNLLANAAIVSISSSDAFYAGFDDIAYSVSKAGLNNLTKSLAAMLVDKKIRVNAIAPGWVDTEMAESADIDTLPHSKTFLNRNATTEEIAEVVSFLISKKASFINGAIISVDGGYSAIDYVVKKEHENR